MTIKALNYLIILTIMDLYDWGKLTKITLIQKKIPTIIIIITRVIT